MSEQETKPYPNATPFRVCLTAGGREFAHEFAGQVTAAEYDRMIESSSVRERDGREVTETDLSHEALDAIYEAHGSSKDYPVAAPYAHRIKAAQAWVECIVKCEHPEAAAAGDSATVKITIGGHEMRLTMRSALTPQEDRDIRRARSSQTMAGGEVRAKGLGLAWHKLGKAMLLGADGYADNGLHSIPPLHVARAAVVVWLAANEVEAVGKN